MEEQWIKDLRTRFEDREQPVPEGLWDSINAAMTERGLADGTKEQPEKKVRMVPLWVKRAVASAACLAIIIGVTLYFVRQSSQPQLASAPALSGESSKATARTASVEAAEAAQTEDEELGLMARTAARLTAIAGKAVSRQRENIAAEALSAEAERPVLTAQNMPSETERAETAAPKTENKDAAAGVRERYTPPTSRENSSSLQPKRTAKHSSRKSYGGQNGMTLGLYGAGMSALSISSDGGNSKYDFAQAVVTSWDGGYVPSVQVRTAGSAPVRAQVKEEHVKHRQPLKFGLMARVQLTDRLGVESGLYYTYLSSDFVSHDNHSGHTTEQRLHYVGVPLKLNVSLWRTDLLEVYAGAGGAAELCVKGKAVTEWDYDNEVVNVEETDARERRPQFSVNASAGVQYNFSDMAGVYAEPGLSYYINNGSQTKNFYKDKPWNFNINVGLRFTLK